MGIGFNNVGGQSKIKTIGKYSRDTTIDVSNYNATSADNFLFVPDTEDRTNLISASGLASYYVKYKPAEITLNNNTLNLIVPVIQINEVYTNQTAAAFDNHLSGTLYFVGNID